ncbi:MAG: DNA repair protein RadA [Pseudomonadota bacterium]
MAKHTTQYVCQQCGARQGKWSGQCSGCHSWNSLAEEQMPITSPGIKLGAGSALDFVSLSGKQQQVMRRKTLIAEFDRVCGGGLVPGSVILVGGDPGIGKSTLLLQVVAALSQNAQCIYVSGEEAIDQVRMRAERLELAQCPVHLATSTSVQDILSSLEAMPKAAVLIVDSIQTMAMDTMESAPGTVSQVRACAQVLIRYAKKRGLTLILVGHVTKEGMIAGPRVLEHMVDTVLYFEGDRGHQFRILRSVKNRFGATDEIGVFEMTQGGLQEVANPSALFLADRSGDVSGSVVFAGIEGTRPLLVEVQALVVGSTLATPRRAVVGWDSGRLSMILAVLEARCRMNFSGQDVYLNIAGGLRIGEPAADLAVAAALVSAVTKVPIAQDAVIFGEIGLAGEIRGVGQQALRLKEAAKLGFNTAFLPRQKKRSKAPDDLIQIHELSYVQDLGTLFQTQTQLKPKPKPKPKQREVINS